MSSKNNPVQQIIVYQRQLAKYREKHKISPEEVMRERIRQSGRAAKLLELTFDLWYPLVAASDIQLNLPNERTHLDASPRSRRGPIVMQLDLAEANLAEANLAEFDMIGLSLSKANLQGANLTGADLSWADLNGANLRQADLTEAHLFEANLQFACLEGAILSRTNLSGAKYNEATIWPGDFDPQAVGALLIE